MKKFGSINYLINKTINLPDDGGYKKYQRCIYFSTDNVGNIVKNIEQPKKCLIPTSSGENSIELARQNIDVYSYDLNYLSYFIQQLRIASVNKLEYDKFINYWFGIGDGALFSYNIYCDLRSGLSDYARSYFDEFYNRFSPFQIFELLFDIEYDAIVEDKEDALNCEKEFFSFYNEKEFYEAKDIDLQSKIRFCECNILKLASSEYKNERNFDLIFFSNILYFLNNKEKEKFYSLIQGYYQDILKPGGAIVNIFHNMIGSVVNYYINFFYIPEREEELRNLKKFSNETIDNGFSHNMIGNRENDLIHLIRK